MAVNQPFAENTAAGLGLGLTMGGNPPDDGAGPPPHGTGGPPGLDFSPPATAEGYGTNSMYLPVI